MAAKKAPAPRNKSRNPEVFGPELLLLAMDRKRGWDADPRWAWAERLFHWFGSWAPPSGKSDNHDRMLAAALLWRGTAWGSGQSAKGVADLIWFWLDLLSYQLGRAEPPPDLGLARFLNAEEPDSNTYGGMSLGSSDSVHLWCLEHPDVDGAAQVAWLCAEYARAVCWLASLGACISPLTEAVYRLPGGDSIIRPHAHRTGSRAWWSGPTLPGVGGRSTVAHVGSDARLPAFMRLFFGDPADVKRFGWPATVSNRLREVEEGEPLGSFEQQDQALAALEHVRLTTRLHFVRWGGANDHVLTFQEWNPSSQTASVMFHYQHGRRGALGYPYPGRVRARERTGEGVDRGSCAIEGGEVVARTHHGEVRMELPREEPASHVVVGQDGVEVLA